MGRSTCLCEAYSRSGAILKLWPITFKNVKNSHFPPARPDSPRRYSLTSISVYRPFGAGPVSTDRRVI